MLPSHEGTKRIRYKNSYTPKGNHHILGTKKRYSSRLDCLRVSFFVGDSLALTITLIETSPTA